jgi:hypothetical protein
MIFLLFLRFFPAILAGFFVAPSQAAFFIVSFPSCFFPIMFLSRACYPPSFLPACIFIYPLTFLSDESLESFRGFFASGHPRALHLSAHSARLNHLWQEIILISAFSLHKRLDRWY